MKNEENVAISQIAICVSFLSHSTLRGIRMLLQYRVWSYFFTLYFWQARAWGLRQGSKGSWHFPPLRLVTMSSDACFMGQKWCPVCPHQDFENLIRWYNFYSKLTCSMVKGMNKLIKGARRCPHCHLTAFVVCVLRIMSFLPAKWENALMSFPEFGLPLL